MKMLTIKDLDVYYGVIHALKGVSIEVDDGEIVALIGTNGAGKSTLLKTISGILKPKNGSIEFDNQQLTKITAPKIVESGITQVPEGRRIFTGLTVLENLQLGAYLRKDKAEIERDIEEIYERFPILRMRKNQDAGTLSGGEQQMLAIGRALMSKPKIILLDEPSMGLAPILVKEIFSIIQEVNKQGVTVLLVEQNARMALSIANKAYVLENGKIVLSGTGDELANSDEVKKVYLGG